MPCSRKRGYPAPFAEVVRATVLLAADGLSNVAIAARLDVSVDVASVSL